MSVEPLTPQRFRDALLGVAPASRDAWIDRLFGLDALPDDGPLPRGCVPYLPCSVDAVFRAVEIAGVTAEDVFVDVGSGVGRAAALVHMLTGASVIGVEIQPHLVRASRALMARLHVARFTAIEGDAPQVADAFATGTVFFFYCPFDRERLERVLDRLEGIARQREVRVCCVDLPLPERSWLVPVAPPSGDVVVMRSRV